MTNVIEVVFGGATTVRTEPAYQYDYGQTLYFADLELPETFEVHFANSQHGEATTSIGTDGVVAIPDMYLTSGAPVYAWVYLHTGEDDGETEYALTIPVMRRAEPSDEPPTPEEQSAITQAIAALNAGVDHVDDVAEAIPEEIQQALQEAKDSGEFDGFSPVARVVRHNNKCYVIIRDKEGETSVVIYDGAKGDKGDKGDPGDDYILTEEDKIEIAGLTNAVKYTPQALTDAQKQQARTNIGVDGSGDYDMLIHKPQIGGVTLSGDQSLDTLGAASLDDTDPVVKAVGANIEKSKNLFTINPKWIGTVNGLEIRMSDDGDKVIVNGTTTANVTIPVNGEAGPNVNFPAGTYTFSLTNMSGFDSTRQMSVRYNYAIGTSTTQIVSQNTSRRQETVTFTNSANVNVLFPSGITYTNAAFSLQIEAGSTATAYQRPTGLIDYTARNSVAEIDGRMDDVEDAVADVEEAIAVKADQSDLDTLSGTVGTVASFVPETDENKVNAASFDTPYGRYEHIEYVDLVSNYKAVSAVSDLVATVSIDNKVRFRNQPFSVKCDIFNGTGSVPYFRLTQNTAFPILGTQEIEVYLYIEDETKIGRMVDPNYRRLRLQCAKSGFSKYYSGELKNGWNRIRFVTEGAGTIDWTKSEDDIRLHIYHNDETTVWIGGIFAVKPDLANVIIVDDAPYKTFYTEAYPQLKALGVPVTWAGDWSSVMDGQHDKLITEADLEVLAYDGLSEFSFHNFDGTEQASQPDGTAALADTLNSIRFLQEHGLQPEHVWRAAWQGNSCSYPELANQCVEASATHNGTYGFVQYPWPDRYNIPRWAMQGRDEEQNQEVSTIFNKLRNQHCTIFMYTHGISDADKDVSDDLLDVYLQKLHDGIYGVEADPTADPPVEAQAPYLRATTYSRMVNYYKPITEAGPVGGMRGPKGDAYVLTASDKADIAATIDAVRYSEQSLTTAQKAQARTNIGAPATTDIPDVSGFYTKPVTGIPASDLAAGVIPDISGKADQSAVDALSTSKADKTETANLKATISAIHGDVLGTPTVVSGLYINPNSNKFSSTNGDLSVLVIPITPSCEYTVWKATPTTMRVAVGSIQTPVNNDAVSRRSMHSAPSSDKLTISAGPADTYLYIQLYVSADDEQYKNNAVNMASLIVYTDDRTVTVSGTTPSITAAANTRYLCGECSTLSITPPASGLCEVRFTSGTTATVLTLPSTVKMPSWWMGVEASKTYSIMISDGVYGAVMAWA